MKYVQFGCISSDDGDTLAHAKQASGSSLITVNEQCVVRAKHVRAKHPDIMQSDAIIIAFNKEEHQRLREANKHKIFEAKVQFEIQELYFKRLRNSLKNLSPEIVQKLNPTDDVIASYKEEYENSGSPPYYKSLKLGYEQLNALSLILNSSPDLPVLIAGSFGTGKTRLLARATYEIFKQRKDSESYRILLCAHHQSSVDTFVDYFGKMKKIRSKRFWPIKMVRVMANDSYVSSTREEYDDYGYYRSKHDLTINDYKHYELVLTTFGTASSLPSKLCSRKGFFTHILIDEGAQIREPEMISALTLAGTETRIIIAGDHYQVSIMWGQRIALAIYASSGIGWTKDFSFG